MKKKKLLSLLLVLTMVMSLIPGMAISAGAASAAPAAIATGTGAIKDWLQNNDSSYDYVYYGGMKWRVLDTAHEVYTDAAYSTTDKGVFLLSEYGLDKGIQWHGYYPNANPADGTGYVDSSIRAYLSGEGSFQRFEKATGGEAANAKTRDAYANKLYDRTKVDTSTVTSPAEGVKYYTGDDADGYDLFTGTAWEAGTDYYTFTRHSSGADADQTFYSGYRIGDTIVSGEAAAEYSFASRYGITDAELDALIPVYQAPITQENKYSLDTSRCLLANYDQFWGDKLSGDRIYLLSAAETAEADYGFAQADGETTTVNALKTSVSTNGRATTGSTAYWWLRSAPATDGAGLIQGTGGWVNYLYTSYEMGVRPALNLKSSAVLFASDAAAGSGKSAARVESGFQNLNSADSWKLTVIDDTLTVNMESLQYYAKEAEPYVLKYSGASTCGSNVYVSMIITDKTGANMYGYQKLAAVNTESAKNGRVPFTLPDWYSAESCDLTFFLEKVDETTEGGMAYKTDYCSSPKTLDPTANDATFKVLLIGNSYTDDAKEYLGKLVGRYSFLNDLDAENVVLANLTHGGRTVAFYANCAKAIKGVTESNSAGKYAVAAYDDNKFDTSYYNNTEASAGSEFVDPTQNSLSYREWDAAQQCWVNKGAYNKLNDALLKENWDVVVIQGYGVDFSGDNHLSENLSYLTSFIESYCPQADTGFYFHWTGKTSGGPGDMSTTWAKTRAAVSAAGIDVVIPIGTTIENLRYTYLKDLQYDDGASEKGKVMGLQRDSGHLSWTVGRYAAGITMLDSLMHYMYPNAAREKLTSITDENVSEVGQLPDAYVDMIYDAADAARANMYQLTNLSAAPYSYPTVDPAETTKTALESSFIDLEDVEAADAVEAALEDALASNGVRAALGIKAAADGLRLKLKDGTLQVSSDTDSLGSYTATVTVQFGYTFREAAISGVWCKYYKGNVGTGTTIVDGSSNVGERVDGTSGKRIVIEYVAPASMNAETKAKVETAAAALKIGDGNAVLDTIEANLYVYDGSTLTKITDAELSQNIEVLVPYAGAAPGETYTLYHWNGTGFDGPISAEVVTISSVNYLKFSYNKFSPFIIVGSMGYSVRYAMNGADSAEITDSTAYTAGTVVTVSSEIPTKTGFVFDGWILSYENKEINAGGSFTMPAVNVTLEAQWKDADSSAYIVAQNPANASYGDPYTGSIAAKKADAENSPLSDGAQYKLVADENGAATGSTAIAADLTMDIHGVITGTPNAAGTYEFYVRIANASGEWISDARKCSITVDKAPLTVTYTSESVEYGTAPALAVAYSGWKFSDDAACLTTAPTVDNTNKDVGTYALTPADGEDENYSFDYVSGSLTITPAPLTVTYAGETVTYGNAPALETTVTGFKYDETAETAADYVAPAALATNGKDAATYELTPDVSGASARNYTFTAVSGELIIEARPLTLTGKTVSVTKGSTVTETTVKALFTVDNIVAGDTVDYTATYTYGGTNYSTAAEAAAALTTLAAADGDYTVTIALQPNNTNYSGGSANGTLHVYTQSYSAPTTYAVSVSDAENGTVEVSTKSAASGKTVTVTITPDKGYALDTITTKNANGESVALTTVKEGSTYTFTMPASEITVSATFAKKAIVNPFKDVKEGDYYYDAVLWAVENELTSGTSDTTFSPAAACDRAQMVTFLWKAAGCPKATKTNCPFTDVDKDAYYYEAVLWAVEKGIVSGTSATTYSPEMKVTRGQAVTFLARANGVKDDDVGYTHSFNDVASSDYFSNAVAWAATNKIISGTSATTFSPNDACLRGQIVTLLYRTFVK